MSNALPVPSNTMTARSNDEASRAAHPRLVIATDYPGFGNSSAPAPSSFEYTFDNLAKVMNELTKTLGIANYVLFMQDYRGPVGFRMALSQSECVRAIIIQNAVSYERGLSPLWRQRNIGQIRTMNLKPQGQLDVP